MRNTDKIKNLIKIRDLQGIPCTRSFWKKAIKVVGYNQILKFERLKNYNDTITIKDISFSFRRKLFCYPQTNDRIGRIKTGFSVRGKEMKMDTYIKNIHGVLKWSVRNS